LDFIDKFSTICLITENQIFVISVENTIDEEKLSWSCEFKGYFKQTLLNKVQLIFNEFIFLL